MKTQPVPLEPASAQDVRPLILTRPPDPGSLSEWRAYGWRAEPDPQAIAEQYDGFAAALRRAGARVAAGTTPVAGDPDAIYVRDPVLVVPGGAILLRPGKEGRRGEPDAVGQDLGALGVPLLGALQAPATAEGGDMFFLDESTLLVGRSYRTNEAGIAALKSLLPEVTVLAFDLPHHRGRAEVMHLMSLISPIGPQLVVGYLPLLPTRLVQLLHERRVQLVEVPDVEFETMGANVLGVRPGQAVALEGNPETRQRLEVEGVSVERYHGSELSLMGDGGPTCLTLPLGRYWAAGNQE